MKYIHRKLEPIVKKYIDHFPIVGLTGPRQSGKSTMLSRTLLDYEYVTFDKANLRSSFHNDPERFMSRYQNKVIFDEVQKVPEIFESVKVAAAIPALLKNEHKRCSEADRSAY